MTNDPNKGILELAMKSGQHKKPPLKKVIIRPKSDVDLADFGPPSMPVGLAQVLEMALKGELSNAVAFSKAFNTLVPNARRYFVPAQPKRLQLDKFVRNNNTIPECRLSKEHRRIKYDRNILYLDNSGKSYVLGDLVTKLGAAHEDIHDDALQKAYDIIHRLISEFVVTAQGTEPDYVIISDDAQLRQLGEDILMSKQPLALDIETNGLDPHTSDILGIGVSLNGLVGYYIPLRLPKRSHQIHFGESQNEPTNVCSPEAINDFVRNVLTKKYLIAHNAKFEYQFFKTHYAVSLNLPHDTMVAEYILDCRLKGRYNLGACVKERFPLITEWKESKSFFETLESIAISKVGSYCAKDCCNEYLLFMAQFSLLVSQFNYLTYQVDMPFIKILAEAELQGFSVDEPYLLKLSDDLGQQITNIDTELKSHIGDANPDSPQQLRELLFDKFGLEPVKTTASGAASVDAESLEIMQKRHDNKALDLILERRGLKKLKTTYTTSLIEKRNKATGNIHPSFMNTDTETGRLSCRNPNFQIGNSKIWRIAGIS